MGRLARWHQLSRPALASDLAGPADLKRWASLAPPRRALERARRRTHRNVTANQRGHRYNDDPSRHGRAARTTVKGGDGRDGQDRRARERPEPRRGSRSAASRPGPPPRGQPTIHAVRIQRVAAGLMAGCPLAYEGRGCR